MKKIRTLRATFDFECQFNEIQQFRKSVAYQAGFENILFHNHLGDNALRYSYPLIQYKTIDNKASVLCYENGVDELDAFFRGSGLTIDWKGERQELNLEYLGAGLFTLNIFDSEFEYSIMHWKALNGKNYEDFMKQNNRLDQLRILEKVLTGNILSMAKGLGYHIEKKITVKITRVLSDYQHEYKGVKFHVFNVFFKSNAFLPDYAGLGKNSSIGYGIIYRKKLSKH